MYREKIKLLDCTIRDGGLINNHYFTDEFVRSVYKALSKSGIDYMEFGYRSSRELYPSEDYGAWKYCDDDKIQSNADSKGHTGLHDTYAAGSRVGLYNSLYGHRNIKRASSLCDSISKNGRQGKIHRVLRANTRNPRVASLHHSAFLACPEGISRDSIPKVRSWRIGYSPCPPSVVCPLSSVFQIN